MDIEKRLERIEKIVGMILVKVNHMENEPLREALRKCTTPNEVKDLIKDYRTLTKVAEQTEPSDDWICTTCKHHKDSTEERAVECRECGDGGHYERKEQTENSSEKPNNCEDEQSGKE